jgi:uncharacterized protein YybS (DUF2232 family)
MEGTEEADNFLLPFAPALLLTNSKTSKKVALVLILLVIVFKHTTTNIKRQHRITSTVKVIRASIFIMLSVLEVIQRVPPTCITNTSRTWEANGRSFFSGPNVTDIMEQSQSKIDKNPSESEKQKIGLPLAGRRRPRSG